MGVGVGVFVGVGVGVGVFVGVGVGVGVFVGVGVGVVGSQKPGEGVGVGGILLVAGKVIFLLVAEFESTKIPEEPSK